MTVPRAERVVELYVEEDWLQKEIAEHFDVSTSVISIILRSMRAPGTRDGPQGRDEKPWRDENTMRSLYHGENLTQSEIADKMQISTVTVRRWLKKHGISTDCQYDPDVDHKYHNAEWLHEQYWQNRRTVTDIANECDVTVDSIYRHMEKNDIPRRQPGQPAQNP